MQGIPPGNRTVPPGTQAIPPGIQLCSHSSGATPGLSELMSSEYAASMLTNLLPASTMKGGNAGEGIYVGDGRPPIASKLVQRIRQWEFVDMGELLSEFSQRDDEAAMNVHGQRKKTASGN
jgi:hypothetical protein